jgi:hypothetical protein
MEMAVREHLLMQGPDAYHDGILKLSAKTAQDVSSVPEDHVQK